MSLFHNPSRSSGRRRNEIAPCRDHSCRGRRDTPPGCPQQRSGGQRPTIDQPDAFRGDRRSPYSAARHGRRCILRSHRHGLDAVGSGHCRSAVPTEIRRAWNHDKQNTASRHGPRRSDRARRRAQASLAWSRIAYRQAHAGRHLSLRRESGWFQTHCSRHRHGMPGSSALRAIRCAPGFRHRSYHRDSFGIASASNRPVPRPYPSHRAGIGLRIPDGSCSKRPGSRSRPGLNRYGDRPHWREARAWRW